jgi:hypothetical protein
MVNHASRPEVVAALANGSGSPPRGATLHRPLLYAAIRLGEGPATRVVRVAIPTEIVAASDAA